MASTLSVGQCTPGMLHCGSLYLGYQESTGCIGVLHRQSMPAKRAAKRLGLAEWTLSSESLSAHSALPRAQELFSSSGVEPKLLAMGSLSRSESFIRNSWLRKKDAGVDSHNPARGAFSPIRAAYATEVGIKVSVEQFSQTRFEEFLLSMQEQICREAAEADGSGATFIVDKWQRGDDPSAGYGITRVLEGGALLEKAAANVSIIRGNLSAARAQAMTARGRGVEAGAPYFAGALSLVFHPCNPYVPTFRSDIRYFEVEGLPGWFGGGADLTPCYLFERDAQQFHGFYKAICDEYNPTLYPRSKALCDKYFYIPARQEHRGVGGIFFDDMVQVAGQEASSLSNPPLEGSPSPSMSPSSLRSNSPDCQSTPPSASRALDPPQSLDSHASDAESSHAEGSSPRLAPGSSNESHPPVTLPAHVIDPQADTERDKVYSFVREVCEGFMPSYLPIAQKRRAMEYGDRERQWQLVRRGRYLEFNLLYDRGVKFGLDGGRVESIMVSAPPLIAWKYMVAPEPGSAEAALVEVLKRPRDWA